MDRNIIFYRTIDGRCLSKSFLILYLGRLPKIVWVLRLMEDLDKVPSSYFKKLIGTEEIWECRIQFGSNDYRIFCFFKNSTVVRTHGFVKKSQKTPAQEIERAEVYRRDFLRRRL